MRTSRHPLFTALVGLLLIGSLPVVTRAAQFDVDAFVDSLDFLDIGERTAFTPPGPPPIPPLAEIFGPIATGNVKGQFEFTCGEGGDPSFCPDATYAADHLEWKWGVLKVTDASGFPFIDADFIEVAGVNLFPSDLVANEGFTFVETMGFEGNPFTRLAHFEFNLEGAGVFLDPGFSYIIFALLSEFPLPNRVPGEGPGLSGVAEESIYQSAVLDGPPFQFHQAFPVFDPTGSVNQLATSRLIPVVPEPASGLLLAAAGVFGLGSRRRSRG